MLNLFRTNQILTAFLFVPYLLLLQAGYFLGRTPLESTAPTGGVLSNWARAADGPMGFVLTTTLLLILAVLFSQLLNNHRLSRQTSLFPGVVFLLLTGVLPIFGSLHPVLPAAICMTILLGESYLLERKSGIADRIFNMGFWIGVAALFYPSSLLLLIFVVAALNIFSRFSATSLLQVLAGAFVPLFLTWVWFFYQGKAAEFWQLQFAEGFGFLSFATPADRLVYIRLGLFAVLLLLIVLSYRNYFVKKIIVVQKKVSVLFALLLVSLLIGIFQNNLSTAHLTLVTLPISAFVGMTLLNLPVKWSETWHLLALVGVVLLQFL